MSEEIQKEAEVVKPQTEETTKKKNNTGKIILIILLILFGIFLLCGVVGFFFIRSLVSDKVDEIERVVQDIENIEPIDFNEDFNDFDFETEEVDEDEKYPEVNNDLEDEDLVSDKFPDDIPLSGGKVNSSAFDQWSVQVEMYTSSSVEDIYNWYENALKDTDWVITSKSRDDDSAEISFDNGEERRSDDYRSGSISARYWDWRGYTTITIRERY